MVSVGGELTALQEVWEVMCPEVEGQQLTVESAVFPFWRLQLFAEETQGYLSAINVLFNYHPHCNV